MTTIITDIPTIVTTAELPDNIEIAIDGASAEVFVMTGAVPIFQTTLFAYEGMITLYDLRAIMEEYLQSNSHTMAIANIWVNDEAAEETFMSNDIYVVYSDFLIQDTTSFFARHFLTTRSSFRINRQGAQTLSWLAAAGESVGGYIDAVSLDAERNAIVTRIEEYTESSEFPSVCEAMMNVPEIQAQVTGTLVSFTVHRGSRSMTFYVTDETPDLVIAFRNAFNVEEIAELYAVTTTKQKVEHSEANCQRNRIFYDRRTEHSYEVETAALPYEEAVWLQQLFASHHIMKDGREILITESESEISDSDSETNRHKFTYKFARNEQTLSPPAATQVFSEEYQSQFQ
ncbi:MAG: hypothetical protein IKX36_11095 [Prevotella sp.]|nr:hypothetical protein [Prevotella sp.]